MFAFLVTKQVQFQKHWDTYINSEEGLNPIHWVHLFHLKKGQTVFFYWFIYCFCEQFLLVCELEPTLTINFEIHF